MEDLEQLARLIARHVPDTGVSRTQVDRLSLIRVDRPTTPIPAVYETCLCLIARGSKRVSLGDQNFVYDASQYLLVSVDLPLVGQIIDATRDEPYLCCKIDLDQATLTELILAHDHPSKLTDVQALAVYPSDPELVGAVCRLVKLLDRPDSIPALAPLIEREILYRLLIGPHGPMLRHLAVAESRLNQVSRAIAKIRTSVHDKLRIKEIAAAAGMSASSLHEHFKAITRMTPLEFQKQLRLQEARQLMLVNGASAGSAGFAVGYESQSQFSREYRRLFGAPPRRDIERLQISQDYVQAA